MRHESPRSIHRPGPRLAASTGASIALTILWALVAAPAWSGFDVERIGVYRSDAPFDTGGIEAVDYHAAPPGGLTAYIVNGNSASLDIVSLADPRLPVFVRRVDLSIVLAAPTGGPTDVAVDPLGRGIAVAVEDDVRQDPGWCVFLALDGSFLSAIAVRAFPASVEFTPDGSRVLVGNEGTPSDDYLRDPEGTIDVIDVSAGLTAPTTVRARLAGIPEIGFVRHFGPNAAAPERDFEPEGIAVSADGTKAFVSLQEHNALAELDIASATFTVVRGLGYKDHSRRGQGLDPSDRDGVAAIATWPVFGMYQPGSVAYLELMGTGYVLGANEGKSRDTTAYTEEAQFADLPIEAPLTAAMQDSALLGRLEVTTTLGDGDGDGRYEAAYAFGARSIAIWRLDDMTVPMYESGDLIEQRAFKAFPTAFNSDSASNASFDRRSDNKGPEPETVAVGGAVCGRTHVYVAVEHMGGFLAFDVTDPADIRYAAYPSSRDFRVIATDPAAGGLGPADLAVVDASLSPTGNELVLLANEVSGTLEVWQARDPLCTGCAGGLLGRTARLLARKLGAAGAEISWEADPAAREYHATSVPAKSYINDIDTKQRPIGAATLECVSTAATTRCTDPDARSDPKPVLFYQVLSACGPRAGEEGPAP